MKPTFYAAQLIATLIFLGIVPINVFAVEYTIGFSASGESAVFDSVVVKNLTKGTTVTVMQGGVLTLTDAVSDVESVNVDNEPPVSVFPNPMSGKASISFYAKNAGNVRISVFGMDGKEIVFANENVKVGINSFGLSLPNGAYFIRVKGTGCTYTAKALSKSCFVTVPGIAYAGVEPRKIIRQNNKSIGGTMVFTLGDQLLYKGMSGNNSTVITDSPTGSKSMNLEFVQCRDGAGNYYSVVKIGSQLWMAENLKTTKYRNGDDITYIADGSAWKYAYSEAMCNNYNNVDYGNKYGKLYNWYAVSDSRKLAPTGWHVATHDEWIALKDHVDTHWGAFANVAKALAAHTDWFNSQVEGAVGNKMSPNNYTGFTALPGGDRGGTNGTFFNIGETAFWWTSTEFNISNSWLWYFGYDGLFIVWDYNRKQFGLSVRCVKD